MKKLYVVQNAVQPGDVLLTLGNKPHSLLIAAATGGPISHAALFVSGESLIESRTYGVGIIDLIPNRIEILNGKREYLYCLKDCCSAIVLRNNNLQNLNSFHDRLIAILDAIKKTDYLGTEYPDWDRVLEALNCHPGIINGLKRLLGSLMDLTGAQKIVPGPYCSELVAKIYQKLEIDLSEIGDFPENPAPASFLDSSLFPVDVAIRFANDEAATDDTLLKQIRENAKNFGMHDGQKMILSSVNMRKFSKELQQQVEEASVRSLECRKFDQHLLKAINSWKDSTGSPFVNDKF